jgi:hypothetical protein
MYFIDNSTAQDVTYKPIKLYMKSNSSFYRPDFFDPTLKSSADSALILACKVLNSQEFIDSFSKCNFYFKNYIKTSNTKCKSKFDVIAQKEIFDKIFLSKKDSITLLLINSGGCNDGSMGMSQENIYKITSYYRTIECDDDTLSFAYKYAYHICHEYMHIVGFYHFQSPKKRDLENDIAEKAGWLAYNILKRWQKEGIIIKGL